MVSLHTYLNKAVGFSVFLVPYLLALLQLTPSAIFLCVLASITAAEETILLLCCPQLNRDIKGLYQLLQSNGKEVPHE